MKQLLFGALLSITFSANAQLGVGTPTPNASAQLDVTSTTKGFLPPRMTAAQRDAIAAPVAGLIIYCSDSGEPQYYNGAAWVSIAGSSGGTGSTTIASGTTAQRPASPAIAGLRHNNEIGSLEYFDGTTWNSLQPPGTIIAYAGAIAPTGWALCDGAQISRTVNGKLFNAIGTNWGAGDGATTFHLPDLRGRFLRGMDGGTGRDADAANRTEINSGGNSGDNVGSLQSFSTGPHTHDYEDIWYAYGNAVGTNFSYNSPTVFGYRVSSPGVGGSYIKTTQNNTGAESRPVNANVHYIIKL